MRMTNGMASVPTSAPSMTRVAAPELPDRRKRTPTTTGPGASPTSDRTTWCSPKQL